MLIETNRAGAPFPHCGAAHGASGGPRAPPEESKSWSSLPPARNPLVIIGKKRKKTDNPREGWEDGTPPPHRDFKERSVVLAAAHPWASASSYLSSQSLSDSRCNLHATPRSSHSCSSPSCRFFLCRSALLSLVICGATAACRSLALAASPASQKERNKTDNPREGWEDGTPPPHRDFKERCVVR